MAPGRGEKHRLSPLIRVLRLTPPARWGAAGESQREAGDGLDGRRTDHRLHPSDVQEARRAELVVTPDGAAWAPRAQVDNAMVKALARAFRWRRMLDAGVYGTLDDLARAKGVHTTYVSRVLGLTLLAPEIVEAILDGRQPAELQLEGLLEGIPLDWDGQKKELMFLP